MSCGLFPGWEGMQKLEGGELRLNRSQRTEGERDMPAPARSLEYLGGSALPRETKFYLVYLSSRYILNTRFGPETRSMSFFFNVYTSKILEASSDIR